MPSSSETVANTVGSSRLVSISTAWEVRYHDASVTAYPAAVFLGAVLLFLVQPLVARLLLPHYGGSAVVGSLVSSSSRRCWWEAIGTRIGSPGWMARGSRSSMPL